MLRIYLSFLILLLSYSAFALETNNELENILKFHKSIRATSMGDAIAAYSKDKDGINYNPATLINNRFKYSNESLDTQHTFFAENHNQSYVWGNFGYSNETKRTDTIKAEINSFAIGMPTEKQISWGLKYKEINYTIDGEKDSGNSYDFGIMSPFNNNTVFALLIKDAFQSKDLPVGTSVSLGLTLMPNKATVITNELDFIRSQEITIYKIGMEYNLAKSLTLRCGYRDKVISAGGIFSLPFVKVEYGMYTGTKSDSETVHQLGFFIGK